MPRIELMVDDLRFGIDSPDYTMCGQWFMDLLKLFPPNPATRYQLRVFPYFVPDPKAAPGGYPEVPDWNCDSRYLDTFTLTGTQSASDAARKFSDMIYEYSKTLAKKEQRERSAQNSSPEKG